MTKFGKTGKTDYLVYDTEVSGFVSSRVESRKKAK
jgi:hypothetical protein